ncbi:MAG: hypothetical protein ACYCTE_16615, partial [Acidimicrobiales bacterium]
LPSLPSLPSVATPVLSTSQLDATLGQGASFTLSPPPAWSTIALNPVYGGLGGATKAFAASAGCAATNPSATCLAGISDSALSSALSASGMSAASSPSALIKATGASQHELASSLDTAAMTKDLNALTGTTYKTHASFDPGVSTLTHGLSVGGVLHTDFAWAGWVGAHLPFGLHVHL